MFLPRSSEANDLALRLARLYTKRQDVAVFERYVIQICWTSKELFTYIM